ncbi:LysE family translocator [Pelagibaculum spongiae]|nr:LysE family translocator [Pelagibaculum spongiae]
MLSNFIPMAITALLLFGSPGPAPLTLATTSASFGIKKTLPFFYGILIGTLIIAIGSAYGLALLLAQHPSLSSVMLMFSMFYLLYLAVKIAKSSTATESNISQKIASAPGFKNGVILYLLNPKAYAGFVAIFSQSQIIETDNSYLTLVAITICFLIATAMDLVWLAIGKLLQPIFNHQKWGRWIRYLFSLLLVTVVAYSALSIK